MGGDGGGRGGGELLPDNFAGDLKELDCDEIQTNYGGGRGGGGGALLPDNLAGDLKELDCDEIQTNYGGGRGGTIARQLGRRLKGAGLSRISDKLGKFQNVR